MDPFIVFHCEKVLPDHLAIALAAAARTRALKRGGDDLLDRVTTDIVDFALEEIASGVFSKDDLRPVLRSPEASRRKSVGHPNQLHGSTGDGGARRLCEVTLTDDRQRGAAVGRGKEMCG